MSQPEQLCVIDTTIVSNLLDQIMSIPMASDQSTIKQIKLPHDVTCEVLAGLSNLNIDISTWDPMLLHNKSKGPAEHSRIFRIFKGQISINGGAPVERKASRISTSYWNLPIRLLQSMHKCYASTF